MSTAQRWAGGKLSHNKKPQTRKVKSAYLGKRKHSRRNEQLFRFSKDTYVFPRRIS